jgi:hypothetical protein
LLLSADRRALDYNLQREGWEIFNQPPLDRLPRPICQVVIFVRIIGAAPITKKSQVQRDLLLKDQMHET